MSTWTECETRLVSLLAGAERGPRREGLFALWLTVRVAEGALAADGLDTPAQRKRVLALRRRLSYLTLPAPLRRVITAAYPRLEHGDPRSAILVLRDLVVPAGDVLGPEPADALAVAVRAAQLSLQDQ